MTVHGATSSADSQGGAQPRMTAFVSRNKTVNATDKANLRSVLSYFCSADVRPFSAVDGAGFRKAAQFFVTLGHKYGNKFNVNEAVCGRKTVSHEATLTASLVKAD